MTIQHFVWTEKYRPKTIDDVILPKRLKDPLSDFVKSGEIQNLIFVGKSGIGKTTVAHALANELGADVLFINASLENGIDVLRSKIAQFASTISLTGAGKIVILDEADGLNPSSFQPALRGFIEEFSSNCRFILTCNYIQKLIVPIQSRCKVINFNIVDKEEKREVIGEFLKRTKYILDAENVPYDPQVLVDVILELYPDYRSIINELQSYSAGGMIDSGVLVRVSDVVFDELFALLKNRDFGGMRKWVVENDSLDSQDLFRRLFDDAKKYLLDESVPQLILIVADYQYKSAFVADPEINKVSCLVEIMSQCNFK